MLPRREPTEPALYLAASCALEALGARTDEEAQTWARAATLLRDQGVEAARGEVVDPGAVPGEGAGQNGDAGRVAASTNVEASA